MDPQAFVDGLSASLLAGAAVLLAGALFVALRVPGRAAVRRSSATGAAT